MQKRFSQFTKETNEILERAFLSIWNLKDDSGWATIPYKERLKNAEESLSNIVLYVKEKAKEKKRI